MTLNRELEKLEATTGRLVDAVAEYEDIERVRALPRELKILVVANQVISAIEGCEGLLALDPMAPQKARITTGHVLMYAPDELIDEAYQIYTSGEWADYLAKAREAKTLGDLEALGELADSIAPGMTMKFSDLADSVVAEHGMPAELAEL